MDWEIKINNITQCVQIVAIKKVECKDFLQRSLGKTECGIT